MKRLPKTHMSSHKSRAQPGNSTVLGLLTSPWQENLVVMGMGKLQLWLCFGRGSSSPGAGLPATPLAQAGSASVRNHSSPHPCPQVPQALLRVGEKPASCQVQKESSGRVGAANQTQHAALGAARWSCSGRKAAAVQCVNPAAAPPGHLRQPCSPSEHT